MDYSDKIVVMRRNSWADFVAAPERKEGRLILFTTRGAIPYNDFAFEPGDTLLFGRESAGAPDEVHAAADARLYIPINGRSLNVTHTAAMALGEALRQTAGFPQGAI